MNGAEESFLDALERLERARRLRAAFPEHAAELDRVIAEASRDVAENKAAIGRALDAVVDAPERVP